MERSRERLQQDARQSLSNKLVSIAITKTMTYFLMCHICVKGAGERVTE